MTDCGAVHDWIGDQGFQDFEEVVRYVSSNYPGGQPHDSRWGKTGGDINNSAWGIFWDCVKEYDFEFEYLIVAVRIHRKDGTEFISYQLRKRDRESKVFSSLKNLDYGTRQQIREFLRMGF